MFAVRRFMMTLSTEFNPYPSCKDCVHLKPRLIKEYDRCGKFKTHHFMTGDSDYEYADYARDDKNKCGEEGLYFVRNQKIDKKNRLDK